jgi:hypothetical protein
MKIPSKNGLTRKSQKSRLVEFPAEQMLSTVADHFDTVVH